MSGHLEPYGEFQEWLAEGPTTWSEQSLDEVVRRVAVTPQHRRGYRHWPLMPRRVMYAVAGVAAAVLIVGVAWAVLSGQLLPSILPPASTPEPSVQSSAPRSDGNSALLDDGRVLVVSGGWQGMGSVVAAAQVWDPISSSLIATGRPIDGRVNSTATALYDGRVLVVGGFGGQYAYPSSAIASAETWDPATESFAAAGSMSERRVGHTATLLADRRVLVVGGSGSESAGGSAELWDPASGVFSQLPPLTHARAGHTATLLPDGRVLVVGGADLAGPLASAEVWDPGTNAFSPTGSLAQARSAHTATLLQDGRVLIVGGRRNDIALAAAEVWDPKTGNFGAAGTLAQARSEHAAAALADGRVVLFGGYDGSSFTTSVEFWDPTAATFRTAAPLPEPLFEPSAVLLPDDRRVLVVGFAGQDGPTSAITYDAGPAEAPEAAPTPAITSSRPPADGPFSPTGLLAQTSGRGGSVMLPDGRVLVLNRSKGMLGTRGNRLLDPMSGAAALTDQPNDFRFESTATLLRDGRVLVSGGVLGRPDATIEGTLASVEVWDPATETFSSTGSMAEDRRNHTATLLPDGRVLVVGGGQDSGMTMWAVADRSLATAEIWDPATGLFSPTGPMADARQLHSATVLADGRVLVVGGSVRQEDESETGVASAEIWDPASGLFTPAGSLVVERSGHTATLLADGRVLIVGSGSAEIWDPATTTFDEVGGEGPWPIGAVAVLVPDGRVLFFGDSSAEGRTSTGVKQWIPPSGAPSAATSLARPIRSEAAAVLDDGRVLVIGTSSVSDIAAVVYDLGGEE
jgi:large repetitive protein